ncbi:hypothetical protein EJ06DRAFT_481066 [Trichodelitschia bisporula]|uniref:Alpha-ketoglutarate-dependent dioxygenase AlkB-like domain-containing protein n=1 Tax=Trichodelitschia bisporula TaxID=703511 RepID=A0A6G1HQF8_9PEZI|nr:hypothetical protein EJ06DRAFT_481066 [Trichodelitschia bisporula]
MLLGDLSPEVTESTGVSSKRLRRSVRVDSAVNLLAAGEDHGWSSDTSTYVPTSDTESEALAVQSPAVIDTVAALGPVVTDTVTAPGPAVTDTVAVPVPAVADLNNDIITVQPAVDVGLISELERIAEAHHAAVKGLFKDQVPLAPRVWADGRQDLCETLSYFRAFQGGTYSTNGVVRAYLVDSSGSARDFIDNTTIIARAGGGFSLKDDGTVGLSKDQDSGRSALKAARNAIKSKTPVVIIVGGLYSDAAVKFPRTYSVLGFFKLTHLWCERSGTHKLWKYRFEVLRSDMQDAWWLSNRDAQSLGSLPPPVVQACMVCHVDSPQVNLKMWTCLNPDCKEFWTIGSNAGRYDPRFVKSYTPWGALEQENPFSLVPDITKTSDAACTTACHSWEATRGLVCPKCGRCGARVHWTKWVCGGCRFVLELPHEGVRADDLFNWSNPLPTGVPTSFDTCASGVQLEVFYVHGYRVNKWTLPGVDGFVAHMIASGGVVAEADGANWMFEDIQKDQDSDLERRYNGTGGQIKGGILCNHFTANYGMPYKFLAAATTKSFVDAPRAIAVARTRMNWAAGLLVGDTFQEFNEILALAYMEKNKIGYHDDGETGLGPTIGTISLGHSATMSLRLKTKHYLGQTKSKIFVDRPPVPGCAKYEERLEAFNTLQTLTRGTKEYSNFLKDTPRKLKLPATGKPEVSISMRLSHGDIMAMHGREIQEFFEHAVEPIAESKIRFALTGREIDQTSLTPADQPAYTVDPDPMEYDPVAGKVFPKGEYPGLESPAPIF